MNAEHMAVIGRIARCVYPVGDVPPGVLNLLLVQPLTGLARIMELPAGRRMLPGSRSSKARPTPEQRRLVELFSQLPADLCNPPDGVSIEDQGPFWMGFYKEPGAIAPEGS